MSRTVVCALTEGATIDNVLTYISDKYKTISTIFFENNEYGRVSFKAGRKTREMFFSKMDEGDNTGILSNCVVYLSLGQDDQARDIMREILSKFDGFYQDDLNTDGFIKLS